MKYKFAFSFRGRFRKAFIEPLAEILKNSYGFSENDIFIDVNKNETGFNGVHSICDILANKSDIICVFISDDYFNSEICTREWKAIKTVFNNNIQRVIPICMGIPRKLFWDRAEMDQNSVICLDFERSGTKEIAEKIYERYNTIYPCVAHNSRFADIYAEQLCLHKNSIYDVSLKSTYIEPRVFGDNTQMPISCMIDRFVNSNKDILFIFGEGGFGKTSTIAKLAYDYKNGYGPYEQKVVIIRLRWISKYMGKSRDVFSAILKFMKFDQRNIPDNTLWVFDGLDELCMLEGTNDFGTVYSGASGYVKQLCKLIINHNSKIIITTRPGIDQKGFSVFFARTGIKQSQCTILSFDDDQINLFINKLVKADPELKKNDGGIRFIRSNDKYELLTDICYSAFILYLICSNDLTDTECKNVWAMFHRIFHQSLIVPEYRYDGAEGDDINEFNETYIEDIYKINSRIAFEMFKTGNDAVLFTMDNVQSLLNMQDNDLAKRINDSYSLCCYMAKNNSIIEFAHNDIRDFFICEAILTELSKAYESEYKTEDIVNKLADLLKYNIISNETEIFIKYALEYNAFIPIQSQPVEHIKDIFTLFLKSGGLLQYKYGNEQESYQYYSKNTIQNSAVIYRHIYKPSAESRIVWFDKNEVKRERHAVIEYMKDYLSYSDFSGMNLSFINFSDKGLYGCDFSEVNLQGADLRDSDISDSILINANLGYAYLSGAVFTGADLTGAFLQGASLNEYNSSSDIDEAHLLEATYNNDTIFPDGFYPEKHGMKFKDI